MVKLVDKFMKNDNVAEPHSQATCKLSLLNFSPTSLSNRISDISPYQESTAPLNSAQMKQRTKRIIFGCIVVHVTNIAVML